MSLKLFVKAVKKKISKSKSLAEIQRVLGSETKMKKLLLFRSLNLAQNDSVANGSRPILLIFKRQRNDDFSCLSNPAIMNLILKYYTPLMLFANKDYNLFNYFQEVNLDGPVLRIINPKTLDDIKPKLKGQHTACTVCHYLLDGLNQSGRRRST